MPNPLSAVMPLPTATPDAAPPATRENDGAMSFQVIMEQEIDLQPAETPTPALKVQDADAESELGEIIEEHEAVETSVVPAEKPPAELRPGTLGAVQGPAAEVSSKETVLPSSIPVIEEEATVGAPQKSPDATVPISAESPAQRGHPVAFQTLIWNASAPKIPTQTTAKSQGVPSIPTPEDARQIQRSDTLPAIEPERDMPPSPSSATQAPKPPTPVSHAPTLSQIHLLASEGADIQTESQPAPELEDVQAAKETVLTSARDSGPTIQPITATARAETARAIANQMASVVTSRAQPGTIEVALNPEELGRVSIVLNGRDDGLHMTISAERPETLDLMRRHLSVLEAEFQSFDLGNLSFDLGTSADTQRETSQADQDAKSSDSHSAPVIEDDAILPKTNPDGRIDIRL